MKYYKPIIESERDSFCKGCVAFWIKGEWVLSLKYTRGGCRNISKCFVRGKRGFKELSKIEVEILRGINND